MYILLSRKSPKDRGGLARFAAKLTSMLDGWGAGYSIKSPAAFMALIFRKIDLIHLTDATLLPLGFILQKLTGKPLTLTVHGLDVTYPNRLYQWMLRALLSQAEAVVVDSREAVTLLTPFKVPLEKIFVIKPGISVEQFSLPLGKKNYENMPIGNKLILLTVGNLVLRKGHEWFIREVFSKLTKEFVYVIVGEGQERGRIEKAVKELNLEGRVVLLGRISDEELGEVYRQADIYICPNRHIEGNFEGFGIAAGEAAAMGLPVIASRVDGLSGLIIHGKNGLLVKPEARVYLQALIRLKDKNLREKAGQQARKYTIKNFRWEKTVSEYKSVFTKVCGKNQRSFGQFPAS